MSECDRLPLTRIHHAEACSKGLFHCTLTMQFFICLLYLDERPSKVNMLDRLLKHWDQFRWCRHHQAHEFFRAWLVPHCEASNASQAKLTRSSFSVLDRVALKARWSVMLSISWLGLLWWIALLIHQTQEVPNELQARGAIDKHSARGWCLTWAIYQAMPQLGARGAAEAVAPGFRKSLDHSH